jgi:hypothetical protein
MPWAWLIAAVLANVAVCLVTFRWIEPLRDRWRIVAWLAIAIPTTLIPLLVPLDTKPIRFVASLVTITTLVKLFDAVRTPGGLSALGTRSSLAYCVNGFWHVLKRPPAVVERSLDIRRLMIGLPMTALVVALTSAVFRIDWSRHSVVVEHVVKTPLFVLAVALTANVISCFWRLAGGVGLLPMRNIVAARTPAEFWQRWNVPSQQFFLEDVFLPLGGRRHPVRATLVTFLISGVIHEYVVGIAAGHVTGLQVLFFLLQGVAVALSRQRKFQVRSRTLSVGMTLAFNISTAALFFVSLNTVLSFYIDR